jgi:CBS domain-containing protein
MASSLQAASATQRHFTDPAEGSRFSGLTGPLPTRLGRETVGMDVSVAGSRVVFPAERVSRSLCESAHNRLEAPMRIADVLRNKGAAVVTINPEATVGELLAGLAEQNIGAMVVVGAEGVVGIVSERDVVRQLHTHGASVLSRPVSKIMTSTVATCTKSDTVDAISMLMTKNRVRHVPVMDGKNLIGIVSIGDVVKTRMEELEAEHQQLQSYITQG